MPPAPPPSVPRGAGDGDGGGRGAPLNTRDACRSPGVIAVRDARPWRLLELRGASNAKDGASKLAHKAAGKFVMSLNRPGLGNLPFIVRTTQWLRGYFRS